MNYVICGKFCRCSKVTIESQEVSTSTTIIHTSYLRPLLAGPRVHLAGDGGGLGDAAGPAADAEEVEDDDPRLQVEHDVQRVEVHVHEPVGAVVPEVRVVTKVSLPESLESILYSIILKI